MVNDFPNNNDLKSAAKMFEQIKKLNDINIHEINDVNRKFIDYLNRNYENLANSPQYKVFKKAMNNGWIKPVGFNYKKEFYDKAINHEDGFIENEIRSYLTNNHYEGLKREFNSLFKSLKKIKKIEIDGYYKQFKILEKCFFKNRYNYMVLIPSFFPLIEFLAFNNDYMSEINSSKSTPAKRFKKGYLEEILTKMDMDELETNSFTFMVLKFSYIDFNDPDVNKKILSRNAVSHGKVSPECFNIDDFYKLLMLCRSLAHIVALSK